MGPYGPDYDDRASDVEVEEDDDSDEVPEEGESEEEADERDRPCQPRVFVRRHGARTHSQRDGTNQPPARPVGRARWLPIAEADPQAAGSASKQEGMGPRCPRLRACARDGRGYA